MWSPTTEPPRRLAKPIVPGGRGPVRPSWGLRRMSESFSIASPRCGLAEQQRGAGRRVRLHAVMHFEDFDVERGAQRLGREFDEAREKVHAEAHVAGFDDRGVTRGGLDARLVRVGETGGADDVDDARLGREVGEARGLLAAL